MSPPSSLWVALSTALAVVLAGCSDGGSAPAKDDPFDGFEGELGTGKDGGVIRGVVVDGAIKPVADVKVVLQASGDETRTDGAGRFAFTEVEPGSHFLKASKPGYGTAQQSTDVVAGLADPPVVKILLEADLSYNPFYQEMVFDGYIECSTPLLALCSVPNLGPEAACIAAGIGCGTTLTNDDFLIDHAMEGVPSWVQSEMVWESTQQLGDGMDLLHSWDCGGVYLCDHVASGGSPLLLVEDEAGISEIGLGSEIQNLTVRVFSAGGEETAGLVGFSVQQRFQVFTHVFYGYQPGAWRFSEDPQVPAPQ